MSLKAKDAPERIYIDMERMHDFSDASRAIVSTEHATNPTENDVLYVHAAFMEEVREALSRIRVMVDSEKQRELAAALLAKLGRG